MNTAQVNACINDLRQTFVNEWRNNSKAFVLEERRWENRTALPSTVAYDPETIESLWGQLQMGLQHPSQSTVGLRRHLPPITHTIQGFDDEWGMNSQAIVDDTNLRHLIGSNTYQDVRNAITAFARTFTHDLPVRITKELVSMRPYFDSLCGGGARFLRKLRGLENFGNLRVQYEGNTASIPFPDHDRLYPDQQAENRIPQYITKPDCNFFVDFNYNGDESDRFSLFTIELKSADHKITPGLHLKSRRNCRPETNDEETCYRIRVEKSLDNITSATDNFDTAIDQAFQQAMMNKCELMAVCDAAGICMLSFDAGTVTNLENCIEESLHEVDDQKRRRIGVRYNSVYCAHWEDGSFAYAILCAVVNQLYAKVEGLEAYLDEYSEAIREGTELPGYRDVTLRREVHQRVNKLYDGCARYYNAHEKNEKSRQLTEQFGASWTWRNLDDFTVHAVLQQEMEEQPNSVYKLSGEHTNSGRTFVAKAIHPDDFGEGLFYNEVMIYKHLMSQNNNDELWPNLIEYGLIAIKGCIYYYLGIELLEGEEASQKEYEACARSLRKGYGVLHNDLRPSNFMRLLANSEGKKVVKAFDFGFSTIVQSSAQAPPATTSTDTMGVFVPGNVKIPKIKQH